MTCWWILKKLENGWNWVSETSKETWIKEIENWEKDWMLYELGNMENLKKLNLRKEMDELRWNLIMLNCKCMWVKEDGKKHLICELINEIKVGRYGAPKWKYEKIMNYERWGRYDFKNVSSIDSMMKWKCFF